MPEWLLGIIGLIKAIPILDSWFKKLFPTLQDKLDKIATDAKAEEDQIKAGGRPKWD